MNDSARGSGRAPEPSGVVIGSDAVFVGVGCITVATAALLGVEWLRDPLLGIPAGLWLLALGYALMRAVRASNGAASVASGPVAAFEGPAAISLPDRAADAGDSEASGQLRFPFGGASARVTAPEASGGNHAPSDLRGQHSLLERSGYRLADVEASLPAAPGTGGRLLLGAAGAVASVAGLAFGGPSRLSDVLSRWHDGSGWPARPLRVGLDLHSDLAAKLIRAGTGLGIEWVPVAAGSNDGRECAACVLDGIVRMDSAGDVRFATAEHPGREAGWYDWSRPLPLSYCAVFPTRVDPCVVTLARGWNFDTVDAPLIARLVQAAAIFSRCQVRLGFSDRLRGRRPIDLGDVSSPGALLCSSGLIVGAVSGLAESVCTDRSAEATPLKAAARLVGAWVSTTDVPIDPEVRREAAEAALRVLGAEPEAILRAVATRFATYDDSAAFAGALEDDAGPGSISFCCI